MYYHFCRFAVWFLEFNIAIAKAAPVNNMKYIRSLEVELAYWDGELDREVINHV